MLRDWFYSGNRRWKLLRAEKLSQVRYRCEGCGRMGCRLEVHHIEPINERSSERELYPALEDLKVLCTSCHNREHQRGHKPVAGRREWRMRVRSLAV